MVSNQELLARSGCPASSFGQISSMRFNISAVLGNLGAPLRVGQDQDEEVVQYTENPLFTGLQTEFDSQREPCMELSDFTEGEAREP